MDENVIKPLYTKKGSKIWRYKDNVGKLVERKLYFHKLYAKEFIPESAWKKAIKEINISDYNTIRYNLVNKEIAFMECPNFDIEDEPILGNIAIVYPDRKEVVLKYSNTIYHHKWLWVKDDYQGFDILASWKRSQEYLALLNEAPKGTMKSWQKQLEEIGMF